MKIADEIRLYQRKSMEFRLQPAGVARWRCPLALPTGVANWRCQLALIDCVRKEATG